jgi:hypothetical protein
MVSIDQLTVAFDQAISAGGMVGADRLCEACVQLLDVDGAAISLLHEGVSRGTFGSSGEVSRRLDELQFTFGEGPCLDAVAQSRPMLIADLRNADGWSAFTEALLKLGIRAVFALPVAVDGTYVGALDLFRNAPGRLSRADLSGALLAAEVAELPLLQLMNKAIGWDDRDHDKGSVMAELASLSRVEVYQATGMIMGRLNVGPDEALIRLRAYAFASDMTASEVAWEIVERRLTLDDGPPGQTFTHPTGGS